MDEAAAVLAHLLAVVGMEDDERPVEQAGAAQVLQKGAGFVRGVGDLAVVQVAVAVGVQDAGDPLVERDRRLRDRRGGGGMETLRKLSRRRVGAVRIDQVDEAEERLIAMAADPGAGDGQRAGGLALVVFAVRLALGGDEVVVGLEAAIEMREVADHDEAGDEGGGFVARLRQQRGGGGSAVGEAHVKVLDTVPVGVQAGQHRSDRRRGFGGRRVGALEEHSLVDQRAQLGRRGASVAVPLEVIGAQGVDDDPDGPESAVRAGSGYMHPAMVPLPMTRTAEQRGRGFQPVHEGCRIARAIDRSRYAEAPRRRLRKAIEDRLCSHG